MTVPATPKAPRFRDPTRYPPLLEEHPRWLQILLAVVAPVLFGALTGYVLGVSATTYLVLSVVAAVGGIGAGFDHRGSAAGAKRGLLGGALFGGAFLVTHELHGVAARAALPDPAILLLLITITTGAAFGALGGRLREGRGD